MFYVKALGPSATAVTYQALSEVKMGKAILYRQPLDLDLDAWQKATPYGFDRLDTQALELDRNNDGEITPDGDLEGDPFWQVKWALFSYSHDDDFDQGFWLCVVTRRRIFLLGENGKTIDRV
jgi:hypothetical protein